MPPGKAPRAPAETDNPSQSGPQRSLPGDHSTAGRKKSGPEAAIRRLRFRPADAPSKLFQALGDVLEPGLGLVAVIGDLRRAVDVLLRRFRNLVAEHRLGQLHVEAAGEPEIDDPQERELECPAKNELHGATINATGDSREGAFGINCR